MTKEDIIRVLSKHDASILRFPDRGPWGDNKWRGNCSGWVIAYLIWKYRVRSLAELFAGSGTGYDVCRDMGIPYFGADLCPVPVRPGIVVLDAVNDAVPEAFSNAEMLFMHPPYGKEINIPYAGSMYEDPDGSLARKDLGQTFRWEVFMKALNWVIMKYYTAAAAGSRMAVLMGDVRRNGLHSMLMDIVRPGILEQVIIKEQFNTCSHIMTDNPRFVPLIHEYIMVIKKPGGYEIAFCLPKKYSADIRDAKCGTWRDVVATVLHTLDRPARIQEIYPEIEGHKKAERNPHWKEKVRQTLYINPNTFVETELGWMLRECAAQ